MNAGQRSFKAFMIAFSILTTAPGLVTRFLSVVGVKKLFAAPASPAPADAVAAPASLALKAPLSAATASSSGAMFLVNLSGNCVMSFWRKLGSFSYCLDSVPWLLSSRWVRSS